MNKRVAAVAALGIAAASLTGCRTTVPTDFGPWPVGWGVVDIEPGLWKLSTAPVAPKACKWKVLIDNQVVMTGNSATVQIPDAKGVKFASAGCGTWTYWNPGEWKPW